MYFYKSNIQPGFYYGDEAVFLARYISDIVRLKLICRKPNH